MSPDKVVVAMSGGVDSAVAALLLKRAGYEVSGIYAELWPEPNREETIQTLEHSCRILDIPFHLLDFRAEFKELVIDYFCHEYSLGRTPNPCIACNRYIKFVCLMDRALQMGADYLATGHYARVERSSEGHRLLKGVDLSKDQSYFLYTLSQKKLEHLLLPLGNLHKAEVRKLATESSLPASSKRDSQDVCFIPDNDYRSFIAEYVTSKPGNIVNREGKVIGRHSGLARYTVGQRQGLGVSSNEKLYAIKLDAATNTLLLGNRDELLSNTLLAGNLSWVSGRVLSGPISVMAKARYRMPVSPAEIYPEDREVRVKFREPQRAITPGQSIVFYNGASVLGGGTIEATLEMKAETSYAPSLQNKGVAN